MKLKEYKIFRKNNQSFCDNCKQELKKVYGNECLAVYESIVEKIIFKHELTWNMDSFFNQPKYVITKNLLIEIKKELSI